MMAQPLVAGRTARAARHSVLAAGSLMPALALAAETPSATAGLLRMAVGLLVVLAVMAALAWLLKRLGPLPQASSVARVVGGVSVGTREKVLVVEVADRWLVVGVAPGQVTRLAEMARAETPAAPATPGGGQAPFAHWLRQALARKT